jgi:GGDEF domain-containing protein
VIVAEFDALSALTHLQSGLQHVVAVLTPRLGALLARDESRGRLHRLRLLAGGLSALAALPDPERPSQAALLVRQLSGAEAVAVWQPGAELPSAVDIGGGLLGRELGPLWSTLRARLRSAPGRRVRELEPAGSELRSLLLVGSDEGAALAAINRVADGPMDELGFRDEDLDHTSLLLAALGAEPGPPPPRPRAQIPPAAVGEASDSTASPAVRQQILEEAIGRELARAQRYHFGFSITCFDVSLPAEAWERFGAAVERRLQQIRRATDFVLWIGPQRFVVLAPEEAHGQRQLARRVQAQLQEFVRERAPEAASTVRYAQAVFPHDGDSPLSLLAACDRQLAAPAD